MTARMNSYKERSRNTKTGKDGNSRSGAPFIGGGIILVLLFLYLLTALFYKSHFYGNTLINGVKASNMTVSKAEEAINSEVKAYQLTLKERNGLTDSIRGKDINLHTEFDGNVSDLLKQQNPLTWPVSLFQSQKYDIKTMMEYNEALLKQCFEELQCFKEENNKMPVNASISEYGENGYEIVPEEQGAKVKEKKLYTAVCKAISNMDTTLSLEEADCYEEPEVTSSSPKLTKALDSMNKMAGSSIIYKFGDKTEVVDGTRISEWLSVDEDYNVVLSKAGVKEFVDYIGKTYNSFGRIRTFQTSYGQTLKVKGGDYGWWLNRPEEVTGLTKMIKNGEKGKREPVYLQTAQQYGDDDIGDTYVEINLTAQHLFFYKDGQKILESDFVSGNVSRNFGTPVGTYPIQYKERDATLVGENYSTPVKYWMPFNKNIGLHDASWRSEFGKNIYLTRGSHGCINMPPENAKKLFQYIQRGIAVVVYELPGTETYNTGKSSNKVAGSDTKENNSTEDTGNKTTNQQDSQ